MLVGRGWTVIAVVRDEQKGTALAEACSGGSGSLEVAVADLSSAADIEKLPEALQGRPLRCLINNAAITPKTRTETAAGEELSWAVNVLAYHRLTKAMLSALKQEAASRVVMVASFYAGGLNLDDPEFKQRSYSTGSAYQASKQANRMQAEAWAAHSQEGRRAEAGAGRIAFLSCHPGVATSNVSLGLGFDLDRTLEAQQEGAKTPVFLATADDALLVNGAYYTDSEEEQCHFCADSSGVRRLWDICEGAR